MSIKVSFNVQKQLNETIWEVKATPHELSMLGKPYCTQNGPSILFIENLTFVQNQNRVECQAIDISIVNLGTLEMAIAINITTKNEIDGTLNDSLIDAQDNVDSASSKRKRRYIEKIIFEDREFIERLEISTPKLRKIGTQLLSEIRKRYHGNLVYKAPRFVESPDNFWTVTVQDSRTESLRITIYGKPGDFIQPADIEIKQDRGSYSNFVLTHYEQVPSAIKIVLAAMELKRRKK